MEKTVQKSTICQKTVQNFLNGVLNGDGQDKEDISHFTVMLGLIFAF